jgi:WD40 repeat protein
MILNDIMTKRKTTRHSVGVGLLEPQFIINFMHMTPDDTWLFLLVQKVSDYISDLNESYICAYDLYKGSKHPPLIKKIETGVATTGVYTCKNPEDPEEIFLFTADEKGTVRQYSLPSFKLVKEYKDLHQDYVLRILGNGEYVITGGSRGTLSTIEIKNGNIICQSKKVTLHA